jgi:hypothetical protein
MVDPITVGTLAATALSMTAEAALKAGVGEAVKDAYNALKQKIARWASDDVTALEKAPTSEARKGVIAEIIDQQPEAERESLRILVEALIARLKENAPTIGLDVGKLIDMETHLRKITVTQGIGARISEARGGSLEVDEIVVGSSLQK